MQAPAQDARFDVAVIGGGVIGCAIARELMRYRLRAVLIEKECEVGFGTSKANSGIIHAGHHSDPATLKGRLEWEGNRLWPALAEQLGISFKRIGELTVAFDESERQVLRDLLDRGRAKGVPGLELWGPERLHREEPNVSEHVVEALHAPTAGVVNPYEACFSLIESARSSGLELSTDNRVQAIAAEDGRLSLNTAKGPIHSRFVINAAGLFADEIANMAGANTFGIRPRKGEEYLLDKRLKDLVKRLIFPCPTATSKGILVIPTYDGTIMVGPTAHEVDDKDDLTTTAEGSDEVFEGARRLVPGISERDCIAEFAGVRAVADSEDFIIEASAVPGFINVAGIQSPGLTAAPAIAELVIDLLKSEGLELEPNRAFQERVDRPVRFVTLSTSEQKALAAKNPRYGRITCRCELITEAEVVDAIHRGATTLDGLKFRTRTGMGRCQGGFCGWRCLELLSSELGVPISSITKRGGDSWLVTERTEPT